MLRADGRFFHLDFGFILGSDPKPMPGPFRLSAPMVDGMGGREHPNYQQFKTLCVEVSQLSVSSATVSFWRTLAKALYLHTFSLPVSRLSELCVIMPLSSSVW